MRHPNIYTAHTDFPLKSLPGSNRDINSLYHNMRYIYVILRKDLLFKLRFTVQVLVMCDGGGYWHSLLLITGQSDIFTEVQGLRLGKAGLSVIRIELILETRHHGVSSVLNITETEKDQEKGQATVVIETLLVQLGWMKPLVAQNSDKCNLYII